MNQILRVLKWFNVCDSSRLVGRTVPFFGHPGIIPFWGYLLLKTRIQQHFLRSQFLFIINMNVAFSWKWGTFNWFPSTIVQFWFLWKNVLKQEIKVFSAAWWPAGSALLSKCKYLSEFCLLSFNSLTMQASRSYVADSCTFTPQALPPFFNLQEKYNETFYSVSYLTHWPFFFFRSKFCVLDVCLLAPWPSMCTYLLPRN